MMTLYQTVIVTIIINCLCVDPLPVVLCRRYGSLSLRVRRAVSMATQSCGRDLELSWTLSTTTVK